MDAADVARELDVAPEVGLPEAEAQTRLEACGPNVLVEAARPSTWQKLGALLADRMTLVLLAAALVSALVSREFETPLVILTVIALNTIINFVQEHRAESSLQALRVLAVEASRVRRDGHTRDVPRSELVPGDVVLIEAGDTVPADGRLIEAERLEVSEAALTGESTPVAKSANTLHVAAEAIGDRTDMLFMHTQVTRGRATMLVTATGMHTQVGAIAALLQSTLREKTPLQRRIAQLAQTLTMIALGVVALVFGLGLLRGQSVGELAITSVSLAVATIPEGLTAVVAFTLAMGAARLAHRGAIIKQLSAVETLGCTTQIASDKTGTLTLNQMTARQLHSKGRAFRVTGGGYATEGQILTGDGRPLPDLTESMVAMALCGDAMLEGAGALGDPTELALLVLAHKGGVDVEALRRARPRIGEVPFDADYRFMATLHAWEDGETRLFAKGAPDALLERCTHQLTDRGSEPLDAEGRARFLEFTEDLAHAGMRTLAIAGRVATDSEQRALDGPESIRDLVLYALVGIADPPRAEARESIRIARAAGISVRMVTGDHRATGEAIARDLGIEGEVTTGVELDHLDEQSLAAKVESFGVLTRVAPAHKLRVVKALQARGHVVAVTGDGVNDAPALQQADIGVAMGRTGTDVSKGAASVILTDDNFATIVAAIEEGRGIYANIIKFVKFQLATSWGFVLTFLGSGVLGLAEGAPFTALQILWVNLIMDGPPALSLGVDPTEPDTMHRPPRPTDEPLLTPGRIARIAYMGAIMAVGTLTVLALGERGQLSIAGDESVRTLAFTTFVFFQVFNLLNVRASRRSVFSLQTFTNASVWVALFAVVLLQVAVVNVGFLQRLFDTRAMSAEAWAASIAIGSAVLWFEELRKLRARRAAARRLSRHG